MADLRAALAALVLAGAVLVPGTAEAAVTCSILDFQSVGYTSLSRLVRVDLPAGTTTDLGSVGYQVLAAGYSKDQDVVYGITAGSLLRRPRLVTVDRRGAVKDLGPVRDGVGGIAAPTGGTVAGSRLYLRDVHRLYTMDIDPRSPSYKSVLRVVRLAPVALALSVDDFAADPSTGVLYGISTFGHTAKVVSLDPVSGAVRVVAAVPGAPWQDSYSSVVVGSSELYAVQTGHGRRSRLFRIGFNGSSTELASWKPLARSDAAGCLSRPVPPPPPPTPTPTPTPTPSPTVRPTPTPTPRPRPTTTSVPPRTPTSTPSVAAPPPPLASTPSRPSTSTPTRAPVSAPPRDVPTTPRPPRPTPPPTEFEVAQQAAAVPEPEDRTVQVLRRWSLATLLLILFGGAAAAAQRRMRRR